MPARTLWQVLEMLRESRGQHCLECFLSLDLANQAQPCSLLLTLPLTFLSPGNEIFGNFWPASPTDLCVMTSALVTFTVLVPRFPSQHACSVGMAM